MGFMEAITSGFGNITNFEGRSSRSAFWWWMVFIWIIELVVSLVTGGGRGSGFFALLGTLIMLVLWLATLAVGCRRLHDTGKSGWLQLLLLIPCIGAIVLIVFWVQPTTPGDNAYGAATA